MDGEVDGGDGAFRGRFPPVGKLLVVNHRLGVEQVEAVVEKAESQCVMVLFSPSMDVLWVFIHVVALQEKQCQTNDNQRNGNFDAATFHGVRVLEVPTGRPSRCPSRP